MIAKPPLTGRAGAASAIWHEKQKTRTKEALLRLAAAQNVNDTRAELSNGGYVVSEDTHVATGRRQVDLIDDLIVDKRLETQGQ